MREKGAQWLVTLGVVHHWARRQVSPTSLTFGESSSFDILGIRWVFLGDPRDLSRRFGGNFGHF